MGKPKPSIDRPVSQEPSVRVIRHAASPDGVTPAATHIALVMGNPGERYDHPGSGSITWYKPKPLVTLPNNDEIQFAFRGETLSPRLAVIFRIDWYGTEDEVAQLIDTSASYPSEG